MKIPSSSDEDHSFLSLPSPKRPRHDVSHKYNYEEFPPEFIFCQYLLATSDDHRLPNLPLTLRSTTLNTRTTTITITTPKKTTTTNTTSGCVDSGIPPIGNNVGALKQALDRHGFRTSLVTSPRPALSIYKDSATLPLPLLDDPSTSSSPTTTTTTLSPPEITTSGSLSTSLSSSGLCPHDGKTWLITMMGLHPDQETLERLYWTSIKDVYCLMLFCLRIREVCPRVFQQQQPREEVTTEDDDETSNNNKDTMLTVVVDLLSGCELQCRSLGRMKPMDFTYCQILQHAHTLVSCIPRLVKTLIQKVIQVEPKHRMEQLEREYERIQIWNSTLSNAMISLFMRDHQCTIEDIVLKQCPQQPQYERITIFLHQDGNPKSSSSIPHFLFLPNLSTMMRKGPEAVVEQMVQSFWSHMLRLGYYATQDLQNRLSMDLTAFFLGGIITGRNLPISLNAQFSPTRPLSLYLYGKAGSGKSSFVRHFPSALEEAINEAIDPEILTRFVKQNLNKRLDILGLEMELRPNNNDMSVMNIIQQRRMTMTQTKPGLVVIDLEEMPSNDDIEADPNQERIAQLISQRFSGRRGDYQSYGSSTPAPRNSDKRGIAKDASLITLFTSNYVLHENSKEALKRLKMFETLEAVHMVAVAGSDRVQFANSYLRQCIRDYFSELNPNCSITLDIEIGEGDTRPLVRYLRMIAFYICSLVSRSVRHASTIEATVQQKGSCCIICSRGDVIELNGSISNLLLPVKPRIRDTRVQNIISHLNGTESFPFVDHLSVILDFWFAGTLTPAVIVSNDREKIHTLMNALNSLKDLYCIRDVNPDIYKMMKSLYDPNDIPNLRDEILKLGRHHGHSHHRGGGGIIGPSVVVELICHTSNAQLCIREIIEDSPSMTAFSSTKSALYKDGLLFVVYVEGMITPEIQSRASIVL